MLSLPNVPSAVFLVPSTERKLDRRIWARCGMVAGVRANGRRGFGLKDLLRRGISTCNHGYWGHMGTMIHVGRTSLGVTSFSADCGCGSFVCILSRTRPRCGNGASVRNICGVAGCGGGLRDVCKCNCNQVRSIKVNQR